MSSEDISYLSTLSIVLPAVMAAFIFKRLPNPLKVLSVFILVTLFMEGVGFVLFELKFNNMILFHVYTYIEFLSISLVYLFMMPDSKSIKWQVSSYLAVFFVVSLWNLLMIERSDTFNALQRVLEYGFLVTYFVMYLSTITKTRKAPFLELHPYFILTVGFLVYFSGTLLTFFGMHYLDTEARISIWKIHGFLNILLNITYFIVLWKGSKLKQVLS